MAAKQSTKPARNPRPATDPNKTVIPARLGHRLRNAHAQQAAWAKELADLKAEAQELMGEAENLEDDMGVKIAVWDHRKTARFNAAKFKAEHPEVHASYTDLVPGRNFTIEPLDLGGSDD